MFNHGPTLWPCDSWHVGLETKGDPVSVTLHSQHTFVFIMLEVQGSPVPPKK